MRKILLTLTVVLMLVASIETPVASRVTLYDPDEPSQPPVNNADHPWGGDFGKPDDGGDNTPPKPGSVGLPAVDFIFRVLQRPTFFKLWLTTPSATPTATTTATTNQGKVSVNPNLAN